MADQTEYRDPKVTTSRDATIAGSPSWIRWALIALAVLAAIWIISALIPSGDGAAVDTTDPAVVTTDPAVVDGAVVGDGDATAPVVPSE